MFLDNVFVINLVVQLCEWTLPRLCVYRYRCGVFIRNRNQKVKYVNLVLKMFDINIYKSNNNRYNIIVYSIRVKSYIYIYILILGGEKRDIYINRKVKQK